MVSLTRHGTTSRAPAHPTTTGRRRSRPRLAVTAGLVSLSAFGGTVGLMTGWLSLTDELNQRLPLDSPVLGGIALAVIVALPFAVLAWFSARGDPRAEALAAGAGMTLIGWIVVELAFIREVSFFHPLYIAVGVAFVVAGRHGAAHSLRRWRR